MTPMTERLTSRMKNSFEALVCGCLLVIASTPSRGAEFYLDWPGPQFDPSHPEAFSSYIKAHREWMLRLMQRQFGHRPSE